MRLTIAVLLLMALAGCQSNMPRDGGGDNTGELGAPIKRVSPGDIYVELGTAYLADGRISDAFKNARKAVLVDPRLASAHNLLGVLYQRLGEKGKAGEHFRKAVKLEPHNPYALNALGSFLCGERKFDEADAYFRRALDNPLYPTPWVASYNAGQCADQAGKLPAAETYYRAALRRNPRFAPALLRMAHVSFDQDKYLSARAYLERYAQVAKHTADSLWLGVRTEKQLGDRDQVASYALKLRANFPDSEQAKFLDEVQKP
jgi:type IV pilus assembly protein PilF